MRKEHLGPCEMIFIRHGETDWNASGILQGREDIPLNHKGHEQIRCAAKNLKQILTETKGTFLDEQLACTSWNHSNDLYISALYTSPLCRAVQSAQLVAEEIQFPRENIVSQHSLIEWNAGILQGTPLSEIPHKYPEIWDKWKKKRDPIYCVPDGESFLQRYTRVTKAVDQLALQHPGQRILIVCHAGVLDDVYRHAMQIPHTQDTALPKVNAGVYILHVSHPHQLEEVQKRNHVGSSVWRVLRWDSKTQEEIYATKVARDNSPSTFNAQQDNVLSIIYA